jgi:hypothetical protein
LSLIIDKMMRNLEWKLVYQAPQVMIHWPSKLLTDHRKSALDYIHTLFCSPATIFIADGHDLFSFCSFGTGQAKNSLTHSLIFLAITLTVKGRNFSTQKGSKLAVGQTCACGRLARLQKCLHTDIQHRPTRPSVQQKMRRRKYNCSFHTNAGWAGALIIRIIVGAGGW